MTRFRDRLVPAYASTAWGVGASFHTSIRVPADRMAEWEPARITAFFAALARATAALREAERIVNEGWPPVVEPPASPPDAAPPA